MIVVHDGSKLVAVVPLQLRRTPPGLVTLRNAGGGVSDYNDWLLPSDASARNAAVAAILEHLAREAEWIGLRVDGVPESAGLHDTLPAIRAMPLSAHELTGLDCPYVTLQGSMDAFRAGLPGRFRYNIRSRSRRLGDLGKVEIRHADAHQAPRALEDAIRLHQRRWSGQYTSTIFSASASGRAFYRAALPALVDQGIADLASLTLNQRTIATSLGFIHGGRYFYYLPAWDPDYHSYAPSTLLLAHLVERAFELGLKEFDFMLGDEDYKKQWATGSRSVSTLLIAPDNWRGRSWLRANRMRHQVRERARQSDRLRWLRRYGIGRLRRLRGGAERG